MTSSINSQTDTHKIEVYRVSERARLGTLPRHFGRHMMLVENTAYDFLRQFASQYQGGYWHFYELSNGGFYMAPEMPSMKFSVPSNGFEGQLSADAAGITVCLFTFSHLSFQVSNSEVFSRHFHRLRDFALGHQQTGQIFAAVD